jgi:hypothetical protein
MPKEFKNIKKDTPAPLVSDRKALYEATFFLDETRERPKSARTSAAATLDKIEEAAEESNFTPSK